MSCGAGAEHWDYTLPITGPLQGLAPSRMPLLIVMPRPSSEMLASNRYLNAHSAMPYEVPIHAKGGRPPFQFSIAGIPGAAVIPRAPAANPLMVSYAVVTLPAGVGGTYTVTVTDYDGAVAKVSVPVTVNDDAFVFCADGATGGDGTIGAPLGGFAELGYADELDASYKGKTVVWRGGTHQTVVTELHEGVRPVMLQNDDKPHSHIGYPGEVADIDMGAAWFGWRQWRGPGGVGNHCLHNLGITGGAVGLVWRYPHPLTSMWKIRAFGMDQGLIPVGVSYSSNIGALGFTGREEHKYVGIADLEGWDFAPPSEINNGVFGVWYGLHEYAIDDVRVRQGEAPAQVHGLLFLKGSIRSGTVTSCDGWFGSCELGRPGYFFSSWETADGPMTAGERQQQHRYCRLGSDRALADGSSMSWAYHATAGDEGHRYTDRCTLAGAFTAYNYTAAPWRVTMTDCVILARPDSGGALFSPDTDIIGGTIMDLDAGDYADYINDDGQLITADRYKHGWEVG